MTMTKTPKTSKIPAPTSNQSSVLRGRFPEVDSRLLLTRRPEVPLSALEMDDADPDPGGAVVVAPYEEV